mmetsp:Transcript_16269/g.45542  ORF Transcript_16269/g.45542 Transcript_16269/m.45542 type:complete len:419 (-) Transcript_16269:406-1662(-)
MLGQQPVGHRTLGERGAGQQVGDAAIEQEVGLRGVAQHQQAGLLAGQCNAGEVDMRRDVLVAHGHQRVGIGQVALVAHQRAAVALRVVVLGLGEAVVDEEGRPALQAAGQGVDEGLGLPVDLGHGTGHEAGLHRRAQRAVAVFEREARAARHHAALAPGLAVEGDQLHRHRVQHLVADDDGLDLLGQRVQPVDAARPAGQPLALALAQFGRQLDDAVAQRADAQLVEGGQQLRGQRTGAGAELHHFVAAALGQGLGQRPGQCAAEQRRHLGRGDEVRTLARQQAELAAAAGVIPQAGLVERQGHEAVEGQPAAVPGDLGMQFVEQRHRAFTQASNSAAGIGAPTSSPWNCWQPQPASSCHCAAVRTPSAVTVRPRPTAICTMARVMAWAPASSGRRPTKLWSILSLSSGSSVRWASEV